jgi:DNA-binding SARP family transcriptional activator
MLYLDRFLPTGCKVYGIGFLLLCFLQLTAVKGQGLMFNSNAFMLNKRTSYNVFNYSTPTFKKHLQIRFDLSIWDKENLGYIFNLADKNTSYSLSYIYQNSAYLNFNIDSKCTKKKILLDPSLLGKRKWIKVSVDLDLQNDSVTINIDNKVYHASQLGLGKSIIPKLVFGKNPLYTEVPDMAIKDLQVSDDDQSYYFPLNESNGNIAHDNAGEEMGLIENPVWLINESFYWKEAYDHAFANVAGLNFDPLQHRLLMYQRDSVTFFDPAQSGFYSVATKNSSPLSLLLGKNIFNTSQNKIYAYEVYNDLEPKGSYNLATLDMKTLEWQPVGKATFPQQRHHHNAFYNKNQDSIYLFGGYGSYTYYNAFYVYNTTADSWQRVTFKGDTITPRFFSASGYTGNDNEVYIFGGYGNESGSQIVGGRQYYDLYRVNLQTHTIKKLWTIRPNEIFVPANNLILSPDKKYFYAMCYPHETFKTSIKLYRFSVDNGAYQVVSSPIPVISERIESDINLFMDDKSEQLVCTIQEFIDRTRSIVKVYTLSFPPVTNPNTMQAGLPGASPMTNWKYAGLLVLLIIGGGSVWWLLHKRNSKPLLDALLADESLPEAVDVVEKPKQLINSVYVLGEFAVFNDKGRDVTYLFSPKIKQLFVLILLNSRNGSGIASKKISQLLWPDKDPAKTKNIKGVTFNHLRSIISDIQGIELTFTNDIYLFHIEPEFFCDYLFVTDMLKEPGAVKENMLLQNMEIISRGSLLPDMTETWLDEFKLNFEEGLMEQLVPIIKNVYTTGNYKMVLELCRIVLHIDPFNDITLKYQLKSYRRIKGIDYCKKVYDHYTTEYKKSYGVDYEVTLDKLLL